MEKRQRKISASEGSPSSPRADDVDKRPQIGVSFHHLSCSGVGSSARYQQTVGSYILALFTFFFRLFTSRPVRKVQILHEIEGWVHPGEMLLVLGRPGSGCSTLLKALAGESHGFEISDDAEIKYRGIPYEQMHRRLKGEKVYLAELDVHFPELTLGQTLSFAASTRRQKSEGRSIARDVSRQFSLQDAFDTKIGSAMIRGISGGEKRRTSIAEVIVGRAQFQCWDNSTRGLDSLTALRFIKLLRSSTDSLRSAVVMTLYQASQEMYEAFDTVTLLYEGRQIYFGPARLAEDYFTRLGFLKPSNSTTADFLTSLTHPAEHIIRDGYENQVPRLPEEFANVWRHSEEAKAVRAEVLADQLTNGHDDGLLQQTTTQKLSYTKQIIVCTERAFQRIRNESGPTIGAVVANAILGLVVGSAFYHLDETTGSLQQRAVLLFFALIVNSFIPAYEITLMWATRPIVKKHKQYDFYLPVAEGVASIIAELPQKLAASVVFHLPIYFLANLRMDVSAFFVHWLFMLTNLLTMSMLFRLIGSLSRTLEQSIPYTSILSLLCVAYTGFVIPADYMRPWLGWFWRINPVAYTYESLMINEFRDRLFLCSTIAPDGPSYNHVDTNARICTAVGSSVGKLDVDGTDYISMKYGFATPHLWRNLGILLAMMAGFCVSHLIAVQYIPARPSRGEVLLFKRRWLRSTSNTQDDETGPSPKCSPQQEMTNLTDTNDSTPEKESQVTNMILRGATIHWESINYEIKTHSGPRKILTAIDGWVRPKTLTALMGVTGAGKTALLDTLADRIPGGAVSGHIYVNGKPRDPSFRRRMGYVQQDDIHLHTATVREALQFSALMKQPQTTPREQKLAYVEDILQTMEMDNYADAIIGVPGEGLNIEQRRRLTIAVEMAAKPDLLLFLDEPTSGLDSQTAWSICRLLRRLADNGQSILCTVHQPSSQIFYMFDRLLLLDKSGTVLYFGDLGKEAATMVGYFENHGAPRCQSSTNPAQWVMEVTGNSEGISQSDQATGSGSWVEKWQLSQERQGVLQQLSTLKSHPQALSSQSNEYGHEYAASLNLQIRLVSRRIFTGQWRDPTYMYSKINLCISLALINGISFYNTSLDIQGMINILFSNFLITQLFSSINQLVIPGLVKARQLFEARERHSNTYSWPIFIAANLLVELVWQTVISVPVFAAWYYPIGMYRNVGHFQTTERSAATFLLIWLFNLWANTLSQTFGAGIEHAETVVQAATLCFWLSLVFCGILVPPGNLPGFWNFLYRVSPLTYLVEGLAVLAISDTHISCSRIETLQMDIPKNLQYRTCGDYLQAYSEYAGGYVVNPEDTSNCQYCPVANANSVLSSFGMTTQHAWRDIGLLAAYVAFNILAIFGIYWLVRVPRKGSSMH